MSAPYRLVAHSAPSGCEYGVEVHCQPLKANSAVFDQGEDYYIAWAASPGQAFAQALRDVHDGTADAHFREVAKRFAVEHLLPGRGTTDEQYALLGRLVQEAYSTAPTLANFLDEVREAASKAGVPLWAPDDDENPFTREDAA